MLKIFPNTVIFWDRSKYKFAIVYIGIYCMDKKCDALVLIWQIEPFCLNYYHQSDTTSTA